MVLEIFRKGAAVAMPKMIVALLQMEFAGANCIAHGRTVTQAGLCDQAQHGLNSVSWVRMMRRRSSHSGL